MSIQPRRSRRYQLIATAIIIGGSIASIILSRTAAEWQTYRYNLELSRAVDNCTAALYSDIKSIETAIYSIRNFFVSSSEVTSSEFASFVRPYLKNYSDANALVWIPEVNENSRSDFENHMRVGVPGYQILERSANNQIGIAENKLLYTPVAYASTATNVTVLPGLDACISPFIHNDHANEIDSIRLLRSYPLVDDSGSSILMLLPVHRTWMQSRSVVADTGTISFVGGIIVVSELFETAIRNLHLPDIDITVRIVVDSSIAGKGEVLFEYSTTPNDGAPGVLSGVNYKSKKEVAAAGARWILVATPTQSFFREYRYYNPLGVLCIGLLLTTLIAGNILFLIRHNSAIESLVMQRTGELAASQNRLALIADKIREGIWLYSIDENKFTYVSPGMWKIGNNDARYLLGETLEACFKNVHPDDIDMVKMIKSTSIGKCTGFQLEYRILGSKDTIIWISEYGNPIANDAGKVVMIAGVCTDISAKKAADEENRKLEEKYFQSQKVEVAGQLAGCMAHDFNNLLSPIISYSEMLQEDLPLGTANIDQVNQIFNAGLRARDLVRQLLAFSRKQTLDYKPVDLNNAITGFEQLFSRTLRENIAVSIVLSPEVEPIIADVGQIEQVIMNLVVNAADAMPEGGTLTITTEMTEIDTHYSSMMMDIKPGRYALFCIGDTGSGMDAETRKKIFEPFFTTKGNKGTGLGLASVYGIVKQHGGNISVYSEIGTGTSFKVYFPAAGVVSTEEEVDKQTSVYTHGGETILVVDDNEDVRILVERILTKNRYTVFTANNGPEALVVLDKINYAVTLLITDIIMPGMNGVQLYTRIVEQHPEIKVLYMSGYTDNVVITTDRALNFLQKPFSMKGLLEKVQAQLAA